MLVANTEFSGRNFVVEKGDEFLLVSWFIAQGGYEYKVLVRTRDKLRINVRVDKVEELFDYVPVGRIG